MEENAENRPEEVPEQSQPEETTSAEPAGEQAQAEPAIGPQVSQDSRNMALLCHLLGFFTSFIGPLIIWLIKKESDKFVDAQGKEALNFQITLIIGYIISALLITVCIGGILALVIAILDIVFVIMACVAVSKGQAYRYPVCIRFIK